MDMIKVGAASGQKGTIWDEKGRCEIAKIFFSHGTHLIRSIQFLFVDVEHGQFVLSDKYGADHNYNFVTVVLDYPSEFLTGIKGTYYGNGLRTIAFETNKGSYGPHGGIAPSLSHHCNFDIQIGNDCSFGGFYGTQTDDLIENIGVYVKPITSSMMIKPTTNSLVRRSERKKNISSTSSVIKPTTSSPPRRSKRTKRN